MTQISSDVIRGYNDTMILYLLLDEPSYGYEISKQIREIAEGKYIIKETTLYSAFSRMEKKGYIESFSGNETNGKKRKTVRNPAAGPRQRPLWRKKIRRNPKNKCVGHPGNRPVSRMPAL